MICDSCSFPALRVSEQDKRTNNLRNGSIDDLRSKVLELRRSSRHGAGEVSDLTRGLNLFLVSDVLEATNTCADQELEP